MAKRNLDELDRAVEKLIEKSGYAYTAGYLLSQLKATVLYQVPASRQDMAIATLIETINQRFEGEEK